MQWGAVHRHQSLQLSWRPEIGSLYEQEENDEWYNSDQDVWGDKREDENKAKNDEELIEDVLEAQGKRYIHLINVPG